MATRRFLQVDVPEAPQLGVMRLRGGREQRLRDMTRKEEPRKIAINKYALRERFEIARSLYGDDDVPMLTGALKPLIKCAFKAGAFGKRKSIGTDEFLDWLYED